MVGAKQKGPTKFWRAGTIILKWSVALGKGSKLPRVREAERAQLEKVTSTLFEKKARG